ncbi:segregation/condensation protein A [Kroppenstedtia pulmonis]|uniref:Segregation and condensation protein A n=1 Tax=Kroppenstedtia pulmonis TaxID=1380685 RepID=A0A7D4CVI8_9BACL|nr:segregation/condensation protein A [Kroppenstedtia pulmonis]QKG84277.1 segregation/condensation protein A [Kroppenstedtia pulmonis]
MDVKIKLEMFEGPLDLLLHLIDRSELDVCDIPIAKITDQYMEYLSTMQEWELDISSEFLVMAANLLAIKSRMLLPRAEPADLTDMLMDEEEGMDPREELIQRLLEYKKYKRLSDVLQSREEERSQVYTRMPMDLSPYAPEENPVAGLTPDDLLQAFAEALTRQKETEEPMTQMTRDEVSVSDRMEEIARTLSDSGGLLHFSKLLHWNRVTKERIVTTFLALLELMKTKRIKIMQGGLFEDIRIELKPEGGSPGGTGAVETGY